MHAQCQVQNHHSSHCCCTALHLYVCTLCRAAHRPAPYPGAWVEPDGHQAVPPGFPSYLALAFVITIILPTLVLIECFLRGTPTIMALASATLAPYLLVFLPQVLLETVFLNRSFMTPVLPLLYAYYRLWQFIRSLHLVAAVQGARIPPLAGEHAWLVYYLLSLMAFWVFDSGCTLLWLPGMYDWQLQDEKLLAKLSKQRQEQLANGHGRDKAAAAANGHAKEEPPQGPLASGGPAMAAKLRHRWRLAGSHRPAASGEYDSYGFGT